MIGGESRLESKRHKATCAKVARTSHADENDRALVSQIPAIYLPIRIICLAYRHLNAA